LPNLSWKTTKREEGGERVRYYEVKYPGSNEWVSTPSVRGRTYPEGTKIRVVVTDRDGTLLDSWEIPLRNGKPDFRRAPGKRSGY